MSWKFVFDTSKKFAAGSNIDEVLIFVLTTGYKFFTFNGHIYSIFSGNPTGIMVEDLF